MLLWTFLLPVLFYEDRKLQSVLAATSVKVFFFVKFVPEFLVVTIIATKDSEEHLPNLVSPVSLPCRHQPPTFLTNPSSQQPCHQGKPSLHRQQPTQLPQDIKLNFLPGCVFPSLQHLQLQYFLPARSCSISS